MSADSGEPPVPIHPVPDATEDRPEPPASRTAELDLLVGRPPSHHLHIMALLLAGAADLAAFYVVLGSVLDEEAWALWLVVLGMTGMAVMLTHLAGVSFKEGLEGQLAGGRTIACIAWAVWLGLGLAASYLRWRTTADSADSQGEPAAVVPMALVLLGLYLATGTVASVGAYVTHNRMLSALVRARRRRRRLARKQVGLIASQTLATAVLKQRASEHDRDDWRWRRTRERYNALADELRHYSSLYMAQRMQEPPATDGLTQARDRNYPPAPETEDAA